MAKRFWEVPVESSPLAFLGRRTDLEYGWIPSGPTCHALSLSEREFAFLADVAGNGRGQLDDLPSVPESGSIGIHNARTGAIGPHSLLLCREFNPSCFA